VKIGYYKFKRDFNIFYALYNSNKLIDTNIEAKNEIVLGNRNTLLHILIVTNPSCFYCKAVHTEIEKLLKDANDIKVTIRFNVPPSKDNISNKVASRLLEIYSNEPQNMLLDALHEAYKKDVDLNRWLVNWAETKKNVFESILRMSKEWCIANSVNFTPALFINGKDYPKTYDITDLSLFIDDLKEQVKSNVNEEKRIAMPT
jgi:metal-sulfur cluster biosynthetic enzyme